MKKKKISPSLHAIKTVEIWYSVKGRAGKAVSLLKTNSAPPEQRKLLLKELKAKFACGGSLKGHELLLQYDRREEIAAFLKNKNINAKICGG